MQNATWIATATHCVAVAITLLGFFSQKCDQICHADSAFFLQHLLLQSNTMYIN